MFKMIYGSIQGLIPPGSQTLPVPLYILLHFNKSKIRIIHPTTKVMHYNKYELKLQ